jgi:hypothetical protein
MSGLSVIITSEEIDALKVAEAVLEKIAGRLAAGDVTEFIEGVLYEMFEEGCAYGGDGEE